MPTSPERASSFGFQKQAPSSKAGRGVTTRAELKSYALEYHDAVKEYEISLFVVYISHLITTLARNGHVSVAYPVLPPRVLLRRTPQGLINKSDPGSIPYDYVEGVISGLKVQYPDMDIFSTTDLSQIILDWS